MENTNDKNIKSLKEIEYELAVYGINSAFEICFDDEERKRIDSRSDSIKYENMNFTRESKNKNIK